MTEVVAIRGKRTTDPLPRVAGNVVLRRLAATDLQAFQAYRHDPELARYQGWAATPDHDAREYLRYMSEAELLRPGVSCQIGIADAASLDLIGDIALLLARDSRQVEIGFTLRRESQGLGLASAAVRGAIALVFETTTAERVVGIADTRNDSSIRLLERVGMFKESSRSARCRGQPCTELVYVANRQNNVSASVLT